MNMEIDTRTSDQLARYLDLSTSEVKLAAANMANIDTPGYKAMGIRHTRWPTLHRRASREPHHQRRSETGHGWFNRQL